MDSSYIGRAELLEALMNFAEFQRVFKGEAWRDCMAALRQLWEDQGTRVSKVHNVVLQVYLDNMLRDYSNDIAYTGGKVAANIDGALALGGQRDSVALLRAHVDKFVTFIQSGTLEGMPHAAFYGDVMFTRILNKPWTTATAAVALPVGATDRGAGKVVGAKTTQTHHSEGLCI